MTFWVKTEKPSIAEALHAIPSIDNRRFRLFPSYSADLHVAGALHSVEVLFSHIVGVPSFCFEARSKIKNMLRISPLYPYCIAFYTLTAWLCAPNQKIPCYDVCVTGDLSLESGSFEQDKLFPSSFRIIFEETVISVASAEAREGLGADSVNRIENTLFDVGIVLL